MKTILVSACLLGDKCRYDGKSNYTPIVEELKKEFDIVPICPEVLGGLTIPRIPSEIRNGKVINKENKNVTKNFELGAQKVENIARYLHIKYAVLKEKSPSCGVHEIYDGSFKGKVIKGKGITTSKLEAMGIICLTPEEALEKLLNKE